MKYFIALTLLFFTSFVMSQEVVLDFKCDQESRQIRKQTFSISNSLNNYLGIFVKEKKKVQAYLFDEHFNNISQFDFVYLKKSKYAIPLGTSVLGNNYSLFYSDKNYRNFCVYTVNFNLKTTSLKEFDIKLSDERYLKTISHENKVYVLTTSFDNDIIIRELNDNYELELIKIHGLELHKKQRLNNSKSLLMSTSLFSNKKSNVLEIDNSIPNALEQVSQDNKIYKQGDKLYLTFDNRTAATLMYIIDLTDFSIQRKEFSYPSGKLDDFQRMNSYVINDKLLQIASSRKEMKLVAKTFEDSILKSFYFHKEEPIQIKNSKIVQEGQTAVPFVTTREFDETSKFLRKVSSGKLGISGYKKGGNYYMTIGGFKEVKRGAPMMGGSIPSYSVQNNTINIVQQNINPVYSGYSSYTITKSTYFNTTLDLDFNYVKSKVELNIFQKIKNYSDSLKYASNEDVFYHNKNLYFSYFNLQEGRYKLVKF
ncbi:hypothetical protein [Algibacter mikhailovii]|uniref:Uncharacterized protein n=1 Tax=Algibacter mikhailovii TaxID=425498 RepID=A0A918QW73_9FLAO|nr:hypothetical protein [Algibacter mikhailovii]GGZ75539.1 hypothetical protein GCM10007028_11330 [Algibacter mikhailovii]